MLNKFEKIIKKVINPNHEQTKKLVFTDGFYYATDGFRVVQFGVENTIADAPVFEENEKQYNCKRKYEQANETDYDSLEIPYTTEQIKSWVKETKKIHKDLKIPFKLGTTAGRTWIGINPKFLTDAMETTGSNILFVPHKGKGLLMQGNGFAWIIMPIMLQGYESDKHMTEIPIE